MGKSQKNPDLPQGTLDLLVLKALSLGSMHGYGIGQRIRQLAENMLLIEEGTLYPALYRIEQRGWIEAEWGVSENNRKAKYYELTKAGQRQLKKAAAEWEQTTAILARFLTPAGEV